jgi:hypothetical protein
MATLLLSRTRIPFPGFRSTRFTIPEASHAYPGP